MSIVAMPGIIAGSAGEAGGYLLDSFPGALFANGVIKLASTATAAISCREDSGDTETNIGFSGDILDAAAVASHCSSNVGTVADLLDQAGNSNSFDNSTTSEQPEIFNGSTIRTDAKGNIAMYADGINDNLRSVFANPINGGVTSTIVISIQGIQSAGVHLLGSGSSSNGNLATFGHGIVCNDTTGHALGKAMSGGTTVEGASDLTATADVQIIMFVIKENDCKLYVNGVLVDSNADSIGSYTGYDGNISLFASTGGSTSDIDEMEGYCHMCACWLSDQSANAVGIYNAIASNLTMT